MAVGTVDGFIDRGPQALRNHKPNIYVGNALGTSLRCERRNGELVLGNLSSALISYVTSVAEGSGEFIHVDTIDRWKNKGACRFIRNTASTSRVLVYRSILRKDLVGKEESGSSFGCSSGSFFIEDKTQEIEGSGCRVRGIVCAVQFYFCCNSMLMLR